MSFRIVKPGEPVGVVTVVPATSDVPDPETGEVTRVTETSEEACLRVLPTCPEGSFIIEASALPADRLLRPAWRANEAAVVEDLESARAFAASRGATGVANNNLAQIRAKVEALRDG